ADGVRGGDAARRDVASNALEIGQQFGGALKAQRLILLERLVDDALDIGGQVGIQPRGRGWRLHQQRLDQHYRVVAAEGRTTRRHLVEHAAERKDVAARVQLLTPRLL